MQAGRKEMEAIREGNEGKNNTKETKEGRLQRKHRAG
jgi:hypothetical protein